MTPKGITRPQFINLLAINCKSSPSIWDITDITDTIHPCCATSKQNSTVTNMLILCQHCHYSYHGVFLISGHQLLQYCFGIYFYIPRFNEVDRGVYWYHLSVCPSVRLSVCGQNRVRSVSSTILIGSISYLHILSSFRRCVACNAPFKIQKFEILANFLNL